jgi:hypothetical protein
MTCEICPYFLQSKKFVECLQISVINSKIIFASLRFSIQVHGVNLIMNVQSHKFNLQPGISGKTIPIEALTAESGKDPNLWLSDFHRNN